MQSKVLIQANLCPKIEYELLQLKVLCKFKLEEFKILDDNRQILEPNGMLSLWYYTDQLNDELIDTLICSENLVISGTINQCPNTIIVNDENHFYVPG